MEPYETYKDSGIEWIGEIPVGWEVKKLKYLLNESLKYGANEAALFENREHPRYIRITDFGGNGKLREETFKSLPPEIASDYILENGDILFARSGATVGKTFQFKNYEGSACFAGYLIKASPKAEQIKSDFLYAFTKSSYYERWKESTFNQATIQNIGADKYAMLDVPLPPSIEQTVIANFLGRKTAEIDALIAQKERLLELYEEEKSVILNRAITKGIDPNAELKDSGIEWLGEIPVRWEIKKLKYLVSINDECLPETTNEGFRIRYVDISNVKNGVGILSTEELSFSSAPSRARRIVREGDVVISTVRTYLRSIAKINNPPDNLIVSTGFAVIRPRRLNSDYTGYMFYSENLIGEIVSRSKGISYPAINASEIGNIPVPIPNTKEQAAIVNFLDCKTAEIDAKIAKTQRIIELQKEYRTALISEVVTGKIKVLGLAGKEAAL